MTINQYKSTLELNWTKNCIISTVGNNNENNANINAFQITKTELYVLVVTLNTNDNKKLTDLLKTGFKRSVFLSEYKTKIETHTADANNLKRILLDSSFQGVNRLFVLAYDNTENGANAIHMKSPRRYALSKVDLNKFNVLIDSRNFYDQPISDKITKYEELMILCTGKGKDYTTGWLLDYKYYKNHYSIIPANLSFQKNWILIQD